MPQDAEGEASRRVLERFDRSVRRARAIREGPRRARRIPDGGATSRRALAEHDASRVPAATATSCSANDARRLLVHARRRRDPGRAARGLRRAPRSAPASRGRSRASARHARAPPRISASSKSSRSRTTPFVSGMRLLRRRARDRGRSRRRRSARRRIERLVDASHRRHEQRRTARPLDRAHVVGGNQRGLELPRAPRRRRRRTS